MMHNIDADAKRESEMREADRRTFIRETSQAIMDTLVFAHKKKWPRKRIALHVDDMARDAVYAAEALWQENDIRENRYRRMKGTR